jgi:hypothetical protein
LVELSMPEQLVLDLSLVLGVEERMSLEEGGPHLLGMTVEGSSLFEGTPLGGLGAHRGISWPEVYLKAIGKSRI